MKSPRLVLVLMLFLSAGAFASEDAVQLLTSHTQANGVLVVSVRGSQAIYQLSCNSEEERCGSPAVGVVYLLSKSPSDYQRYKCQNVYLIARDYSESFDYCLISVHPQKQSARK